MFFWRAGSDSPVSNQSDYCSLEVTNEKEKSEQWSVLETH